MGAALEFEVACRLSIAPAVVFISAFSAPHVFASDFLPLSGAPDDMLMERIRRLDRVSKTVLSSKGFMKLPLETFHVDIALMEQFRPAMEPKVRFPIVTLRGYTDRHVTEHGAA